MGRNFEIAVWTGIFNPCPELLDVAFTLPTACTVLVPGDKIDDWGVKRHNLSCMESLGGGGGPKEELLWVMYRL